MKFVITNSSNYFLIGPKWASVGIIQTWIQKLSIFFQRV